MMALTHAYSGLKDADKAIETGEWALALLRETVGRDHPYTTGTILDRGDTTEAIRIYGDAVRTCKELPRIDAGVRANTIAKLGHAVTVAKRFDEAEKALLHSYPILLETFGPQHDRTRRAAKSLVALYDAW